MKINLATSLRLFKWSLFVFAIFLVELLAIFPISVLLFNEFYKELVPDDTSQWVPLSAFSSQRGSNYALFTQELHYIPAGIELPRLVKNGLQQEIPLRDHLKYKMDLDIKLYCLFDEFMSIEPNNLNSLDVKVGKREGHGKSSGTTTVFAASFPVVCLRAGDSITVPQTGQLKQSRIESYKTEWLNVIHLEDIELTEGLFENGDTMMVTIQTSNVNNQDNDRVWAEESTKEDTRDHSDATCVKFILDPTSSVRFRVDFTQDIRNWMMKWKVLTYVLGIGVVFLLMTLLFLSGVAAAWHVTSGMLVKPIISPATTFTSPSANGNDHPKRPRENGKQE